MGARQLMVFGLGPMGCIPLQRVLSTTGDCQQKTNKLAISFNQAATTLLNSLSSKLANASFKFGDAYDVVNDVITNPEKYGIHFSFSLLFSLLSFSLISCIHNEHNFCRMIQYFQDLRTQTHHVARLGGFGLLLHVYLHQRCAKTEASMCFGMNTTQQTVPTN